MHYRLRRIGKRLHAEDSYVAPSVHFIYDFDYHVLALDAPRKRFARLNAVIRHPRIVGAVPRTGLLLPWAALSRTLIRRLDLEPEFTKTIVLERLGKDGWTAEHTFHIEKRAVAWVSDRWVTPEPIVLGTFSAALAESLRVEEARLRPLFYGLGESIRNAYVAFAITTIAALACPLAFTVLGDWMRWAARADMRLMSEILSVTLLLAIAYGFFRLKLKRQRFYGALEVGVGIGLIVAVLRSAGSTDRLTLALQVMAAVYVIIRGFVNIRDDIIAAREPLRRAAMSSHAEVTGDKW
jgi:hypothetical protein